MITVSQEDWINNNLPEESLTNPKIQNYLKKEITARKVCPVCGEICNSYVHLNYHLDNEHTRLQIGAYEETISFIMSPIWRLRELIEIKKNTDPRIATIGSYFGDIITSESNQHAMIMIIGKTGTGKSNAGMHIAECVSEYVAHKIGGEPSDYFSMDNVAIMRMETIIPILKNMDSKKKCQVYMFDDIGGEWNARNSQSRQNKGINEIIQTFRDTNSLVIFTMPDSFLIDKVGRKLAHFQIEMQHKLFNFDMSVGKLKIVTESYQTGTTYFVYPVIDGIQYRKIVFHRASAELVRKYEEKRNKIRKQFTKDSIKKITGEDKEKEKEKEKSLKLPKYVEIAPLVNQQQIDTPGISVRKIADSLGVNKATVSNAIKYNNGEKI